MTKTQWLRGDCHFWELWHSFWFFLKQTLKLFVLFLLSSPLLSIFTFSSDCFFFPTTDIPTFDFEKRKTTFIFESTRLFTHNSNTSTQAFNAQPHSHLNCSSSSSPRLWRRFSIKQRVVWVSENQSTHSFPIWCAGSFFHRQKTRSRLYLYEPNHHQSTRKQQVLCSASRDFLSLLPMA